MGSPPTTTDDEVLTLDALDAVLFGIRPPFNPPTSPKITPPSHCHSSSIPFPRFPTSNKNAADDVTPTTAAASLPTPRPPSVTLRKPTYADVVRGFGGVDHLPWYSQHSPVNAAYIADAKDAGTMPACPPGPILRDMDSFTDGTYAGSFDFSLYSLDEAVPCYSELDVVKPAPRSLAFSPEEPLRSIESWRDNVLTSTRLLPNDRCGQIDNDEGVDCSPESAGQRNGPRGIKRHLSWTSDADRDDGGPERARGRWEVLKASSSDQDATDNYIFFDDRIFNEKDHEIDGLFCNNSLEDDLGYVSDDASFPHQRRLRHRLTRDT